MFFPAKQTEQILFMRAPRKQREGKHQHIRGYEISVDHLIFVTVEKGYELDCGKHRRTQDISQRAPFGNENKGKDAKENTEHDKRVPSRFARKRYPKHAERRCDTFTAVELIHDGQDMPKHGEETAKITSHVRNLYRRSRKVVILINQVRDKYAYAPFNRVEKEGKKSHFPTEFSAHVHSTWVTATHFRDIFMFFSLVLSF